MTSRVNIVLSYSTPFSKMPLIIHDDPSYNTLTWKRLILPLTCHIHQTKSIDPSLVIYIWLGNTLQCRHNGSDSASNHQTHDCLHNSLFKRRSKKTPKLRVTGLCVGNSPVTGEFPAQMASNAEKSIHLMTSSWWRLLPDRCHMVCSFNLYALDWFKEPKSIYIPCWPPVWYSFEELFQSTDSMDYKHINWHHD